MKRRPIALDDNYMEHLVTLLENAVREAEDALDPDATVKPDRPWELVNSLMWAKGLLRRVESSTY